MIHLHLQPEIEAQLAAEAGARGLDLDRYIEIIVEARPLGQVKPESTAEAVAAIRDLRKGTRLEGLKISGLIHLGRRY